MRDLVVHGAELVDVVTQTSYRGWFAVQDGRFVEVEAGEPPPADELPAGERVDLGGAVVHPGMLDVHMHIESSLVTPRRFAAAALPLGTTAVLQDPHEVANVLGAEGIRWMVRASQGLPLRVFSAISSCIPATSPDLETPNASLRPTEVTELAREPGVVALGEVMDFQGVLDGDPRLLAIVRAGAEAGLSLEGHVPSLTGPELSRYVAHGIRSDHTLTTPEKLREQLRKGLWVMIQEKSLTPDVVAAV
ncbi:MAG: amidohydrolase family protein, partial [Trueperaceae bacterium]|nr:amidohydrolase family protein [Trueperaceae bacterium]